MLDANLSGDHQNACLRVGQECRVHGRDGRQQQLTRAGVFSPQPLSRLTFSVNLLFLSDYRVGILFLRLRGLSAYMPLAKRQKHSSVDQDDEESGHMSSSVHEADAVDEGDLGDKSGSEEPGSEGESSPDTEDEIADSKRTKSKKTLKRKRRATDAVHFGATLQSLLSTDTPSTLPLSLKPSIGRRRNDEKLDAKGKKLLHVERKDKEERGRIKDVIGGWGGESERGLRKVAQRGGQLYCIPVRFTPRLMFQLVVKLFNVIQQSQAAAAAAEEGLKAQRGTGKPTLPAPSLVKGKKKGKQGGVAAASTDGESTMCLLLLPEY